MIAAAPAVAWIFVSLQLIVKTDAPILEDYGIRASTFMPATVAALVVGGRKTRLGHWSR